ncbi:MAG: hypothetical protein HY426_02950, partial [Candidatus Levybacteria bacterium]|nr:hypothetical protein [Candidatus Levybacteria bacterium]
AQNTDAIGMEAIVIVATKLLLGARKQNVPSRLDVAGQDHLVTAPEVKRKYNHKLREKILLQHALDRQVVLGQVHHVSAAMYKEL